MTMIRLILGSGSPQRKRLMADAGYRFEVVPPDDSAECGICSNNGPASLVVELALRKAANVAEKLAIQETNQPIPSLIIACDTVAECGGAVLGKPTDEEHARAMLTQLSGQVHRVFSGLCLWPYAVENPPRPIETKLATTELRMAVLSEKDLDRYLATKMWQGKAGAFGWQDRTGWLQLVEGSESNVIGLPMELLAEMLVPWKLF